MKLSDDELRMVKKLQKRQQQLRQWRGPLLIAHGMLILTLFILLLIVIQFDNENITAKLTMLVFMLPQIFFFLALSSVWFGYVLWNWRGEPKTDLLLRVIEELQKRDS